MFNNRPMHSMPNSDKLSSPSEVWFLTSELESERAGSFRQERWSYLFLNAGASVRIFNLRGAFGYSDIVCKDVASFRKFRANAIKLYRGPRTSVREGLLVKFLRKIKHYSLADLYLPNVFRVYKHLEFLLRNQNKPVVLMASSPPFSVALISALIKKKYPDKVILSIDMRDAWALHTALGGFKFIKRIIERSVLKRADYVTTVSRGLSEEFNATYDINVLVMYNVATHYLDTPKPSPIKLDEIISGVDLNRRILIYTGSAPENFYDVESIVKALYRINKNVDLANRLQFIFAGACETVQRAAESLNISDNDILFIPHLPRPIARSLQVSGSALIFLAFNGPKNMGVVSTKIFEYLYLGQPIIPFGLCHDSDVDFLLKHYCGSSINVIGEDEIYDLLVKVITEGVDFLPRLSDPTKVNELLEDYICHVKKLLNQ